VLTHVGSSVTFYGLWFYALRSDSFGLLHGDFLVSLIPVILVAPTLRLIDRHKRKHVMSATHIVSALVVAGLLYGVSTTELPSWLPYLAMAILLVAQIFRSVSFIAAIPELVSANNLPWANGFAFVGIGVTMFLGQFVGTVLLYFYDYWALFLTGLSASVLALILTLSTRFRPTLSAASNDDLTWRDAIRWIRTENLGVGGLLVANGLLAGLVGAYSVVQFSVVEDRLGSVGQSHVNYWTALAIIAAVLVVPGIVGQHNQIRVVGTAVLVGGLFLTMAMVIPVLFGMTQSLALALAALYVGEAALTTHIHRHVPPALHGRLFGLRSTLFGITGLLGSYWFASFMVWTFDDSRVFDSLQRSIPGLPYSDSTAPPLRAGAMLGIMIILIGIGLLARRPNDLESKAANSPAGSTLRQDQLTPPMYQSASTTGTAVPGLGASQVADSLLGGVKIDDGAFDGSAGIAEDEAAVDDLHPR
jgi:MFS family permease